jgi:hypothetical protein
LLKAILTQCNKAIFFYDTANNGLEAIELIKLNKKRQFLFNNFQAKTTLKKKGLHQRIYYFVERKCRQFSGHAISFISIGYIVAWTESMRQLFKGSNLKPDIQLLLGMNFQIICLFLLISKLNWIQNAIKICFFQTYLWIRGFDLWKTSTEQTPIFISLGAYFILFPLFLFLKERE